MTGLRKNYIVEQVIHEMKRDVGMASYSNKALSLVQW